MHEPASLHQTPSRVRVVVSSRYLILDLMLNQDRLDVEVLGCAPKRIIGKVSVENLRDATCGSEKLGGKSALGSLGVLLRASEQ
jgi:hypothetical protein